MSLYETLSSDGNHKNAISNARRPPADLSSASEPVSGVVIAETFENRVDFVERIPVKTLRSDGFAIMRVARRLSGLGMTDIGARSEAYVACVHLQKFAGCHIWKNGQGEEIGPLDAGVMHINDMRQSWQVDVQSSFDVVNFCIPQSAFDEITSEERHPKIADLCCPISAAHSDAVMINFAQILLPALGKSNQASRLFVDHTARAITTHLARMYNKVPLRTHCRRGGLAPWQEKRAKEMLRAKLSGDITATELATACRLSVGYFGRAFKQSVGCAPHQWLVHQRVEQAKYLILNTDQPICQIALATGFVDQSHFTRVFSRCVKASPAAWRRDQVRANAEA